MATHIGLLVNPANAIGLQIDVVRASDSREIEAALATPMPPFGRSANRRPESFLQIRSHLFRFLTLSNGWNRCESTIQNDSGLPQGLAGLCLAG
jgi:hypothetical protein